MLPGGLHSPTLRSKIGVRKIFHCYSKTVVIYCNQGPEIHLAEEEDCYLIRGETTGCL